MFGKQGKSEAQYKQCVPPCKRFLCAGDTHSLCVLCLGARHAEAALEGADCPLCESLPLRVLRSRKALFSGEGSFIGVPRGAGPASAEAERRRRSWGSQRDLVEDRRRASLYLHPHLSDLMTALRDRKPALRLLPLGQRPRRFSCLPLRRLTREALSTLHPLFHPNMRSWWR